MKTLIGLLAICSIIFLLCSAAASAQENKENTPRTSEGDRALLFSINGFGNFGVRGSVAGNIGSSGGDSSVGSGSPIYGIGAKLFISPKTALRLALGFGLSSQSAASGSSGEASSSAIAISPAIEFHVVQSGPITAYVGGFASIARTSSGSGGDQTEYSSARTSISIGGILGVEFFAWSRLSFGAEYELSAQFNSSSTTVAGTSSDGPSTTEIGIGTVAVKLGVYL